MTQQHSTIQWGEKQERFGTPRQRQWWKGAEWEQGLRHGNIRILEIQRTAFQNEDANVWIGRERLPDYQEAELITSRVSRDSSIDDDDVLLFVFTLVCCRERSLYFSL